MEPATEEGTENGNEAMAPDSTVFCRNAGQEHIKSVIYVKIVECDGQEEILMVNTQLTPVDATVNTLRIELIWITVIMILLSLGDRSFNIQTDFQVTDPDQ